MNQPFILTNPLLYAPGASVHRVRPGLILIPDISGYSKFVEQTDILLGKRVVYQLLTAIIQTNTLGLAISEIEGDAVLFYRYGKPPGVRAILTQFELMQQAFNEVLAQVQPKSNTLSLKMIAHYGLITEFRINRFKKLYGETLITAHRLLKNPVDSHSYVLMTDDLLTAATGQPSVSGLVSDRPAGHLCAVPDNLKRVCFSYFDYESQTQFA